MNRIDILIKMPVAKFSEFNIFDLIYILLVDTIYIEVICNLPDSVS